MSNEVIRGSCIFFSSSPLLFAPLSFFSFFFFRRSLRRVKVDYPPCEYEVKKYKIVVENSIESEREVDLIQVEF